MNAHPIQWQAPQPLWARFGATSADAASAADQARPAILRFASDDFMEQMLGTLARDPSSIDALVARPETWRSPMAEQADLIERTPIPRIAQSGLRKLLAKKPKASVAATTHEADDPHAQAQILKLPLKLYQPAHQRYYLVASSLICGLPGLPERAVVPGATEQVNYVIRRLLPAAPGNADELSEFAYVKNAQGGRWQRVSDAAGEFVAGEELLPVFPLTYRDDAAHARTLWGGFVPVGRREEFVSANVDRAAAPPFAAGQQELLAIPESPAKRKSKLARVTQFQMEVAEPWKNLIRSSFRSQDAKSGLEFDGKTEPAGDLRKRIFEFNLQQQNVSWLILLDLADFLSLHLPDVWTAIENSDPGPLAQSPKSTDRRYLYDWLSTAVMPTALKNALQLTVNLKTELAWPEAKSELRTPLSSLRHALKAIRAPGVREKLERIELNYTNHKESLSHTDWPDFHFVLAGLNTANITDGPFKYLVEAGALSSDEFTPDPVEPTVKNPQPSQPLTAVEQRERLGTDVDRLTALVGRALVESMEVGAPPLPFALQLKNSLAANVGDPGWFVARFVYVRRDCGPLHPPVLSAPTQKFQLASFFDSDAPARPIRISLPMDTSPAGLRKYSKNTAFVLSDMLCGQVQRAKGLGFIDLVLSVLPWPFHKDLDLGAGGSCKTGEINIGMICSLSIPIITICALILLMIIISLLDFIFRWMPYFIMCFPIPGLKGKKK